MSNLEMLDVGQANELKLAFRRNDWTNEDVKWLCEGTILKEVRNVRFGYAEIKPILHAVNCDTAPYIPDGWSVKEDDQLPNRVKGIFTWDPTKVTLYLSKRQKGDKRITGNDLRTELAEKPVLNANVLDYLLKPENQHLIPEKWKGEYIFFWGTIYRNSDGFLYVRYLYWDGGRWYWSDIWLGNGWSSGYPAALCAS